MIIGFVRNTAGTLMFYFCMQAISNSWQFSRLCFYKKNETFMFLSLPDPTINSETLIEYYFYGNISYLHRFNKSIFLVNRTYSESLVMQLRLCLQFLIWQWSSSNEVWLDTFKELWFKCLKTPLGKTGLVPGPQGF